MFICRGAISLPNREVRGEGFVVEATPDANAQRERDRATNVEIAQQLETAFATHDIGPNVAFLAVVEKDDTYRLWGFELTEADADRYIDLEQLTNEQFSYAVQLLTALNEESTEGDLADTFCLLGGHEDEQELYNQMITIHQYVPKFHYVAVVSLDRDDTETRDGERGMFYDQAGFYDEEHCLIYHTDMDLY